MAPVGASAIALLTWFAVAALATAVAVARLRQWAIARDLLDHPNHRSSHDVPTPRVGGVGLACVLLGGLTLLALRLPTPALTAALLSVVGLGLGVAAISLYDDLRSVAAPWRFAAHVAAAVGVVGTVGAIDVIDAGALGRLTLSGPLAALLTGVWVVSLVNAVNFIDGIDGIAGGQAAVAGGGWIALGLLADAPALAVAGALLVGATMGFLFHNWHPARIFMGDGGSALLGFLLATTPWVLGGADLWLPSACLIWPTLFDTAWTLLVRLRRRLPLWESHRMHLYQQLVDAGRRVPRVSLGYAVASAAGAVVACLTLRDRPIAPVVGLTGVVAFVAWTASGLRWHGTSAPGMRKG